MRLSIDFRELSACKQVYSPSRHRGDKKELMENSSKVVISTYIVQQFLIHGNSFFSIFLALFCFFISL